MYQTRSTLGRLAAIAAAAALSAACSGNGALPGEGPAPSLADVRPRTPLVDDDGWPMPADPPLASSPHAAGVQPRASR